MEKEKNIMIMVHQNLLKFEGDNLNGKELDGKDIKIINFI